MRDYYRIARLQKERLLDITDPKQQYAMRMSMEERDLALKAQEAENEQLGYCHCGYGLTTEGRCMSSNH